ncbi:MAG: threonylcarbamoyl-AMP synthase [Nitrospiraceae bacterium]|nr:MAG: threonylcarbamoyl-AMP synthase [Nitrospiraceae bacterium]
MKILSLNKLSSATIIDEALQVLAQGGIVSYASESFYALGVQAFDRNAVEKLFEIKQRPQEKPVPLIVGTMDVLRSVVKTVSPQAKELIDQYWPGPLTILFPAREKLPSLLTGVSGNAALRIPGRGIALDLAKAFAEPLTATSANISGRSPAETPSDVSAYFGDTIDLIIDSGRAPGGQPSTIVDATVSPPVILRQGRIALDLY